MADGIGAAAGTPRTTRVDPPSASKRPQREDGDERGTQQASPTDADEPGMSRLQEVASTSSNGNGGGVDTQQLMDDIQSDPASALQAASSGLRPEAAQAVPEATSE